MTFYLGTDRPRWLERLEVPLILSHRTLGRRKRLPRAAVPWVLDSGAFTELTLAGRFVTTVPAYLEAVHRYATEIGRLRWAAPMDWPCAPPALEATGLTVREHLERTVANYLEMRDRGPFIPVLQGWAPADFHRCAELYAEAGVALELEPLVGVGSIAGRQGEPEVAHLIHELADRGLRLHGFGVKRTGLAIYGGRLASADSFSWSYQARLNDPLPECDHKRCSHCPRYALRWREALLAVLDRPRRPHSSDQLSLGGAS